jgi:hypothetical protein
MTDVNQIREAHAARKMPGFESGEFYWIMPGTVSFKLAVMAEELSAVF